MMDGRDGADAWDDVASAFNADLSPDRPPRDGDALKAKFMYVV